MMKFSTAFILLIVKAAWCKPSPWEILERSTGEEPYLYLEEKGNYTEGDMKLSPEQTAMLKAGKITEGNRINYEQLASLRNGIKDERYRWKDNVMPYKWNGEHTTYEKAKITAAIAVLNSKLTGCIQIQENPTTTSNHVLIKESDGICWSSVGSIPGSTQQYLNLDTGCLQVGTIQHEFLHALGLYHEQMRSDRDEYVTINWSNIMSGYGYAFDKFDESVIHHYGQPYNYFSLMHYESKAFSNNGQDTITPKVCMDADVRCPHWKQYCGNIEYVIKNCLQTCDKCDQAPSSLGQRCGPALTDINKIRGMYECALLTPADMPVETCCDKAPWCPDPGYKCSSSFVAGLCPLTCNKCSPVS